MTEAGGGLEIGRVLVIIPTYQERENIEIILDRVRTANPEVDVLVADDGSPDGTGQIVDRIAASDSHVHVLHRSGKNGLGAAYIAGFTWGLEAGYDVLVQMDADGSHPPEQLPRLLAKIAQGADVAIGSRYIPGGAVVNWPKSREVLSRGGNGYARMMLGFDIHDATGGFRAYRRAALEKIDYQGVASHGYCFQVDLARRVTDADLRVEEAPITFVERERGESKMSGDIVREALMRVTVWGVAKRRARIRAAIARRRRTAA